MNWASAGRLTFSLTQIIICAIIKSVEQRKELIIVMELDNNAHSVFLLYYHLVLVVKYRRKVFDDNISDRAK